MTRTSSSANFPVRCFTVGVVLLAAGVAQAADIVFPDGLKVEHGLVNVRDHGAKGDGQTDDTAAFRKALDQFTHHGSKVLYIPSGTYLISDTIWGKISQNRWTCRLHFIGQSREKTVLKLKDNCPGFGDAKKPKPVIITGNENPHGDGGGNTAFGNSVVNMTVDLGKGNAGAVGIDYCANNNGSVRDVTVRAAEGSGWAGIRMERAWPGPALIKNVDVAGCQFGIRIGSNEYSMTADNLVFRGQRQCAISAVGNQFYVRRARSDNTVPFYIGGGKFTDLVLLDSELRGGAPGSDAIVLQGNANAYLRNVSAEGYKAVVADKKDKVDEWYTGQAKSAFPSPAKSLGLKVKEIPEPTWPSDASQWANVLDYGATISPPPGSGDDTEAFQKAIDSGKAYILVPAGKYHVSDVVVVRGKVRKIYALGGAGLGMTGDKKGTPPLRIDETESDVVEIAGLHCGTGVWADPSELGNTSKAVVFRHTGCNYTNTEKATGDVFIEDCMAKLRLEHPQNVWAVQYNAEHSRPLIEMKRGGNVWIFGQKTEMGEGKGSMRFKDHRTVIENHGGSLEILGFHMIWLGKIPGTWTAIGPFAINDGGRMSIAMLHWRGPKYPVTVKEHRGEEWREVQFGSVPLYTGFKD